jgi:hypothetical protein
MIALSFGIAACDCNGHSMVAGQRIRAARPENNG